MMRLLAGTDAYHVFEESPAQHMHTMKVLVVDAEASINPVTYDAVRAWVSDRLPRIPPLRWRLVPIPFHLGRPLFIDAPDLDLDYHVRRRTLPSPGDEAQLDDLVSTIASTQLDRGKPLWQLWFVDGLDGGRIALVFKMHHAIADGGASVRVLEEAFGVEEPPDARPPPAERPPSALVRVLLALRRQLSLLRRLPAQLAATIVWMRCLAGQRRTGGPAAVGPLAAPCTNFNRELTPNRSYVNVTVPLADLRRLKDALGGTLNDVFIALCGGAVRHYLEERGELPDRPLTAASPVGLRDETSDPYGNAVANWNVSLATNIAEPAERVAAVRASTTAARALAADDPDLLARWQDHYFLYRLTARGLALAERLTGRPAFNAIVSNVKGPRPLSFEAARVVAVRSMGPIVGRQGLNFTAWSYNGEFAIGLHACREHVPDLRRLADHVVSELESMLMAAEGRASRPRRAR